jgi:predicted ATPase with chaperone activity
MKTGSARVFPATCSGQIRYRWSPRASVSSGAGTLNSRLDHAQTMAACRLTPTDPHVLAQAIDALPLSAHSMHRILREARSTSD